MSPSADTAPVARLPAKEVLRFGGLILLRLLLATVLGLAFMKAGQWLMPWSDADAVLYAEYLTVAVFVLSFLVRPVPYPEIDYGPERPTE